MIDETNKKKLVNEVAIMIILEEKTVKGNEHMG